MTTAVPMSVREAGARGGRARVAQLGPAGLSALGRKGGTTVLLRYGGKAAQEQQGCTQDGCTVHFG